MEFTNLQTFLIVVSLSALLIVLLSDIEYVEGYSQDPSVRVSTGWIAGPSLNSLVENFHLPRKHAFPFTFDRKCRTSNKCLEGEKCLNGVCVPANVETFMNVEVPSEDEKCAACMTTEEFEKM